MKKKILEEVISEALTKINNFHGWAMKPPRGYIKDNLQQFTMHAIGIEIIKKGLSKANLENSEYKLSDLEIDKYAFLIFDYEKKKAYKIKIDHSLNEIQLLQRIQTYHLGHQKNIIKYEMTQEGVTKIQNVQVIEIEQIIGEGLNQLIDKSIIDNKNIIKISSDICNGLCEMRSAGILYHRDIRPANIMIDFEKYRAVIIDFEIATTSKYALSKNNRRFGSAKGNTANDLVSVGQIMYYMATGKHIFEQSESMTKTFSDVAEEINDYRTKVYSDETGELLKLHLEQVDTDITDDKLRELTKACLTAKHYQYNKINKMFKEYLV